jgi:hypothetical protein
VSRNDCAQNCSSENLQPASRAEVAYGSISPIIEINQVRHDALQAHLAGLPEHRRAVVVCMIVEHDPRLHAPQQPGEASLALVERRRTVQRSPARLEAQAADRSSESVRGLYQGLHSFRNMRRMEASLRKARALSANAQAITAAVESALAHTFGHGTVEYRRYSDAALFGAYYDNQIPLSLIVDALS